MSTRSVRTVAARAVMLVIAGGASMGIAACGGGEVGATCDTSGDCVGASLCVEGVCVARSDGGFDAQLGDVGTAVPRDGGGVDAPGADARSADARSVDAWSVDVWADDVGSDATSVADDGGPAPDDGGQVTDASCGRVCGLDCCEANELCLADVCVATPSCTDDDGCANDSFCDEGRCRPWEGSGAAFDPACTRTFAIEPVVPNVQCRWPGPAPTDPQPLSSQVVSTAVVADFDLDRDPATVRPSIVVTSFVGTGTNPELSPGAVRILDGETCALQATLDYPAEAAAAVAIGNLDASPRPEIVVAGWGGGVAAFGYDEGTRSFRELWRGARCGTTRTVLHTGGGRWGGPSIVDLDDDGLGEVVFFGAVFDSDGCILDTTAVTTVQMIATSGLGDVMTVVDLDGDGRVEMPLGGTQYEWSPSTRVFVPDPGFTAGVRSNGFVATGDFGNFGERPAAAEVVVVSLTDVRVQTATGRVVFGPISLQGRGGPPTVADFDGDGRLEFATLSGGRFVVYDLDCADADAGVGCQGTGIRWARPVHDQSGASASSAFDFDADGRAEVLYADECYVRVFDGATGEVRYSAPRSSATAYETPVVVDVDGDLRSEIVVATSDYAAAQLPCDATDPYFPASRWVASHGVVVLREPMDRWAVARPTWNQLAYHLTNVRDDGSLPRPSAAPHWQSPATNSFRMNTAGSLPPLGEADLTASPIAEAARVACTSGRGALTARVCNRGALPMSAGFEVSYRGGSATGTELCRATSPVALAAGACTDLVTCDGPLPDVGASAIDVYVVVDPAHAERECLEMNNVGVLPDVACFGVP